MASGPHFNKSRGTYTIKWFDGSKWTNATVYKINGWKPGSPRPKKDPPEALAMLKVYADREAAARRSVGVERHDTIDGFLAAYLAHYEREQAAGSVLALGQAIGNFARWREKTKVRRMDDLTPAGCQTFLDWRAAETSRKTGKPIAPVRVHLEKALLAAAWARGLRLGMIVENPWKTTTAPGWERQRRAKGNRPSWTPEEFARLIEAAQPWLRDLLTLGTQCGLRIKALTGLEWRDVEWAKDERSFGMIRVRPELDKVGRGYGVPISPKAHDLLMAIRARRDSHGSFVLAASRGGQVRPDMSRVAILSACALAGLPQPTSPNHHMRRTFGRWAVFGHLTGQPIPVYTVMRWLGHSDIATTQKYLDLHDEESQDWMMGRGRADQPTDP